MNILVIGNGGREHTIVWKLSQSPKVSKIYTLPGNGGTAAISENLSGSVSDFHGIDQYVKEKKIDLIVVGPEVPLVEGIVDYFEAKNIRIFGPNQQAAQLEGSKSFSKKFMQKHGVPTAEYEEFTDIEKAKKYIQKMDYPSVIKADGLAAGKGVVIVQTQTEAENTLNEIMKNQVFGAAGSKIIIEEFLKGEEASILAFVDADTIIPMVPAQDHKAIYDGDTGPNTGGMGAYSPAPIVNAEMMKKVQEQVFDRMLAGFKSDGLLFKGILYAGLMIHKGELKVLEFNVRFGDPETQVVLPRLDTDLVDIFNAVIDDKLADINIKWKDNFAVCVVLASGGYPGSYEKGKIVSGLEKADGLVFHAGTKLDKKGIVTDGGRVFGVTALGSKLTGAIESAYKLVDKINFDKKIFRTDIGKKALKYIK
ncbi:MAG: phosphoribosylamine--glycine ligase [Candidatus Margulisbacteria bacterium GWF2_35_9]|nr:MAG: phosphoribosylamine--glycine ligase [Candidatus Margulisbacteria bacterium GWF2_35_9]